MLGSPSSLTSGDSASGEQDKQNCSFETAGKAATMASTSGPKEGRRSTLGCSTILRVFAMIGGKQLVFGD